MPATIDEPARPAAADPAANNGSITTLVTGILDDAKTLVRQQVEMVKSEVREDVKSTIQAAQFGSIGLGCLIVGALAIITALANLLHEQLHLQMWISWGIIGVAFLVIGGICAAVSNRILTTFNPLPDKSFTAIKENLTWNRNA